jgi:hypothetical protein
MDIFFADPSEIPLPPNEVRIRALKADLWPDGRRVKVFMELDPFQKRPNAVLTIVDPEGQEIASADIIETMTRKIELNLHLRGELKKGNYTLDAVLFYADLPELTDENQGSTSIERQVVDTSSWSFMVE